MLYEQGLIGLAWFGSVLVASMLYLGRRARKAEGLERALLSRACVAVVVYAVVCITDNALDCYGVLGRYVTVLAAMAMASASTALTEGRQRRSGLRCATVRDSR